MENRSPNRLSTKAIYLATAAAMIALTGGFVMATTVSSISAPPAQGGGYTATGTPPAGVANTGVRMTQAGATAAATTNSLASPHQLTVTTSSGTDTVDVNAVTAGDFVETLTMTLTAGSPNVAASAEYSVSIYIAGATSTPQVVYIETSGTFGSSAVDTISFVYDMGSGSGSITISAVSDLVTQCSSVGHC